MSNEDDVVQRAVKCLGRGFDVTCDFRPEHCRGSGRLVSIKNEDARELFVPGFGTINNVPLDIKCDKGDLLRYQSDVLDFTKMSEVFNRRSSMDGRIPSGHFNSMFDFDSGEWARDASDTKALAMDGLFITLFDLQLHHRHISLLHNVLDAVPPSWNPSAIARFIEKYGTHIITGVSVGGQDVIYVKQNKRSSISSSQLKHHLDELGDELFTGACRLPPLRRRAKRHYNLKLEAFNVFDLQKKTDKDAGVTVMCCKRGGDTAASSHGEWLPTVTLKPDVINLVFVPITSLLRGVTGSGFLSHAINLYLRYKPPLSDLRFFLEFQSHKLWAPRHHDLPLAPLPNRVVPVSPLNFTLLGPKLYVNTCQVIVGRRPVTGMRLHLEGKKSDRLAVHLEHLADAPAFMEAVGADTTVAVRSLWRGSDDTTVRKRNHELVQWKKLARVCTAPVEHDILWEGGGGAAFVVTGAQLCVAADVLHLRLMYSEVRGCTVSRSRWRGGPSGFSAKSGHFLAAAANLEEERGSGEVVVDSGVFLAGPPVPVGTQKMLKIVDTGEVWQGPQHSPGHWLVSGAKLEVEKGKIRLHVKFSLLASVL